MVRGQGFFYLALRFTDLDLPMILGRSGLRNVKKTRQYFKKVERLEGWVLKKFVFIKISSSITFPAS